MIPARMNPRKRAWLMVSVLLLSAIAPSTATGPFASAQDASGFAISPRGPGMKPLDALELTLPVERTFDLSHIQPEYFAAALGHDPERIFAFVRDAIAFESYRGALRGPRGTLLALAGNATDRALLLATLLEASGEQVRFAHGTLPEALALELLGSIWAERPVALLEPVAEAVSPELERALITFEASVRDNYTLIREQLERAGTASGPEAVPDLDTLLRESQDHVWVQWRRDDAWIDFDPSFADSAIGRSYAPAEETWDALPEARYHRVELRIVVEEQTGEEVASREVLNYAAWATELSAAEVVLLHMPENWKGPATSLGGAIADAIEDTGRIRPALLVNAETVMGEPFRREPPSTTGLGGIGNLLGGAGGREPLPITIAETLEIVFTAPNGHQETVQRELFDLVGKARRQAGTGLSAEEVASRIEDGDALDVSTALFSLFFATGGIDSAHLQGLGEEPPTAADESPDLLMALETINIAFSVISDALLAQLGEFGQGMVAFYPDSPQLLISELSTVARSRRLSLDLRRNHTRGLVLALPPESLFYARAFRGVVAGSLERILVELVTTEASAALEGPGALSTSMIFELAAAEGLSPVLLSDPSSGLGQDVPADTLARIHDDLAAGYLALVPPRAVTVGTDLRLAWWRIDPRSGDTVAVTDEGLHQATDYTVEVEHRQTGTTRVTVRQYVGDTYVEGSQASHVYNRTIARGAHELSRDIGILVRGGGRLIVRGGRFL